MHSTEKEKVDKYLGYFGVPYDIQRQLDQLAYSKYYKYMSDQELCYNFNGFYGTEEHKEFIQKFLRKYKLTKIEENF